jgi:hypothetical protein
MLNEALLALARWLDGHAWSTALHESLYLYAWIETTHVLTLTVFLGMLFVIDLKILGLIFPTMPAALVAERLDKPMIGGFVVMVLTGLLLYYAIPVRTTQSIWFRIKVVLMIAAGINALLFRNRMRDGATAWDGLCRAPQRLRVGAILSLVLWAGVVVTGRAIAYDWFDCSKPLTYALYWAAGCVDELARFP